MIIHNAYSLKCSVTDGSGISGRTNTELSVAISNYITILVLIP